MEHMISYSRMQDTLKGIGIGIILTLLSLSSITYAATGGKFGEVMNIILTGHKEGVAGRTWDTTTDYTVEKARTLSGKTIDQIQQTINTNQLCGTNQYIKEIKPDGSITCL